MRKKQKTKEEWLEIIRELYVSPFTQAEWARRHNVSMDSISRWRTILRREGLLDDLLEPVELDMLADSLPCALLEERKELRLMLCPVKHGGCIRSLRLKAWSCGGECNDGNTYVFADKSVNRIYLLSWKDGLSVDTTIEMQNSSLKWPKRTEKGKAVMGRNELMKLLRVILPYVPTC